MVDDISVLLKDVKGVKEIYAYRRGSIGFVRFLTRDALEEGQCKGRRATHLPRKVPVDVRFQNA